MKAASLRVLAGMGGVLLVAAAAPGEFSGVSVTNVPNQFGLLCCRVYAKFTNPADRLVAVAGTPESPFQIGVLGGTFYQNPFNLDIAPHINLAVFPSLAYDTCVDIGRLPGKLPPGVTDATLLFPPWPGFGSATLSTTGSGWYVTPDQSQAAPNAQGQVFLGQFSTANGTGFTGQMLLQMISDGQPVQAYVRFCHPTSNAFCFDGDLDGNNIVDDHDFQILIQSWGPCAACPADLDGDGAVGIVDFLSLLANWTILKQVPGADADLNDDGVVNIIDLITLLDCVVNGNGCAAADLNGDGSVGIDDFLLLLGNWG